MTDTGVMTGTHNLSLVILSIVISIIACYATLALAEQVTVAQRLARKLWLAGGAIAMGVGMWSMHFIAMLAYNLPIHVAYDVKIVIGSMLLAVVASAVALLAVSRQQMGTLALLAGSICMGLGIFTMHYTGMAAMRLEAIAQYDFKLVALSFAIALISSLIALRLVFHLRTQTAVVSNLLKLSSASGMGIALAGMHYTGMAAVSFKPTNLVQQLSPTIDNSLLGVGIGLATFVILALAVLASIVTQRLSAETARAEALSQSEERFRSLVQNSSDIIAVVWADSSVGYISPSSERILGYKPENWQKAFEFIHPDDLAEAENLLTAALNCPGINMTQECRFQHANGSWRDFEVIINNQLTQTSVSGIVATYRDITERKQAHEALQQANQELEIRVEQRTAQLEAANEELRSEIIERKQAEQALRESEERYRRVVETATEGIWIIDAESKTSYANSKMAQMLGYTTTEMLNASMFEFIDAESRAIASANVERRRQGIKEQHDFKFRRKDGSDLWAIVSTNPIFDSSGEYAGALGMITDITERKQAEEALQKAHNELEIRVEQRTTQLRNANEHLQIEIAERQQVEEELLEISTALENAVEGISRIDPQGYYVAVNKAYARINGYELEEMLGMQWQTTVHPEDLQKLIAAYQHMLTSSKAETETRGVRKDGSTFYKQVVLVASYNKQHRFTGHYCFAKDITERKQAEEALRQSEDRFRTLIQDLHVGVMLLGPNAQIKLSNQAALDLFGLTESQLLGKTCFDRDWKVIHEDGSPFLGETLPVPQAIATRQPVRGVVMGVCRPTQGERVWLLVNAEPQFTADGNVKQVICSLNDISDRKRIEEKIKKLNADLEARAVELETANQELEAFSYSVSHDLRAPLRAINGFSRILLKEYAPKLPAEVTRYLQMVQDNAQQMGNLIDDLLTFSRLSRSPLKKQLVNSDDVVRQALDALRHEQNHNKVEISLHPLPTCKADQALLKQVWINLLSNAIKYSRQHNESQIEVGCQLINSDRVYFVKDNGVGFDMQYAHKLFGVFQRLHRPEEYEGTGVGLAIVQRIIHRHGGQVWAEAEVNKGAKFYFTLGGDNNSCDRD